MLKKIFLSFLISTQALAGLPPTSTKGSGDSNPITTFQLNFPNIPLTHSGTAATIGTIPIGGGGTGQTSKSSGFDALSPNATKGDITVFNGTTNTNLAAGGNGQVPVYDSTQTTGIGYSNHQNKNLLTNPSFEYATPGSSWNGPGLTISSSSDFTDGKQSGSVTLSSNSGNIIDQQPTLTQDLSTSNLEFSIWVKTSVSGIQVCAVENSTVVGTCQNVSTLNKWGQYTINYPGVAASGSVGIRLVASSVVSGTVLFDDAYVGPARNVGTVAQAQLIGQLKITGCAAGWSTTSATMASFSTQTGCSYSATAGTSGTAPATNIPGISFSSLAPGTYVLKYEGTIGSTYSSASGNSTFQFWDGTNTSPESSLIGNANSAASIYSGGIQQTITYSTPQSNVTLSIRGLSSVTGVQAQVFGTTAFPGVISVYYFPSQSQTVANLNNYDYDNATCTVTGSWSTNTTYTCLESRKGKWAHYVIKVATSGAPTTATLTVNMPSGRTIDSSALTTNDFSMWLGGANTTDGSTGYDGQVAYNSTTAVAPKARNTTGNTYAAITQAFPYTFAAGGSVTLNFWVPIVGWSGSQNAPLLIGSVTSGTSGMERVERVQVSSACASSPCTISSQSGSWITSVTRTGTGNYVANFGSNMFSSAPTCVCSTGFVSSITSCVVSSITTSSVGVATVNSTGAVDDTINLICMGPR